MADRKYYVICDSGCKFESMTKEQILTAIQQAVATGKIGDCDTGFITTVKTINGTPLKFFVGAQSEYELLTEAERRNLFAIITNDTNKESIEAAIEELTSDLSNLTNGLLDGSFVVTNAINADSATIVKTSAKTLTIPKGANGIEITLDINSVYAFRDNIGQTFILYTSDNATTYSNKSYSNVNCYLIYTHYNSSGKLYMCQENGTNTSNNVVLSYVKLSTIV